MVGEGAEDVQTRRSVGPSWRRLVAGGGLSNRVWMIGGRRYFFSLPSALPAALCSLPTPFWATPLACRPTLPVTLPAAALYVQQGTDLPWLTIASLIIGLWIGTDIGARFANRVTPEKLRIMLMVMIATMAIFMAFKAWR